MRPLIMGLMVIVLLVPSSFAETIYLKDGKVVKGQILERSSYHVVVKQEGFPRRYYLDQVDRIEADQPGPSVPLPMGQAPAIEGLSQAKADLIVQFIEASGAWEKIEKDFEGIIESVPYRERDQARELLKVDEVIKQLIPVYDQYYTVEDLKKLIEFYSSPTGQKVIEVTPQVMRDVVNAMQKYFQDKMAP
ncbi:MAG: DUF2059 domain-containing protein [Candidatus Omnitrophota bacterium]|nr:DUF2059 domain-containing protein [Candidatus Omnitrophota bacterium]